MNLLNQFLTYEMATIVTGQLLVNSLIAANLCGNWPSGIYGASLANPAIALPRSIIQLLNLEGWAAIGNFAQAASSLAGSCLLAAALDPERAPFHRAALVVVGLGLLSASTTYACTKAYESANNAGGQQDRVR